MGQWQMANKPPESAGLYEREWGDMTLTPIERSDYWNGECWKYAYDGQPTTYTAVPNKRWRKIEN